MEAELESLDEKINQLAQLCRKLRMDNSQLRQQLATARSESKRLGEKVDAAKLRLETLLGQIPDGSE